MIECKKDNCRIRYIGETKRIMKFRLAVHGEYIFSDGDIATREHLYFPGHSISDLRIKIIEKVKRKREMYRRERKNY